MFRKRKLSCVIYNIFNYRGRAKKRMEDLDRRLNLAKKNFVQWGGKLEEDRRRLKEDRDSQR